MVMEYKLSFRTFREYDGVRKYVDFPFPVHTRMLDKLYESKSIKDRLEFIEGQLRAWSYRDNAIEHIMGPIRDMMNATDSWQLIYYDNGRIYTLPTAY